MLKRVVVVFVMIAVAFTAFASGQADTGSKSVVLKMGDNLPDRTVNWGAVVEEINDAFVAKHPEVKFEVESYQDQAYQEKIKIYATAGQLPDIMKYWSFSTLLGPLVESNNVAELNRAELENMGWLPGALDSNMIDGKLYGIPVSADLWVIYYNKAIFDACGVAVPKTLEELMSAAKTIRAKGYTPIVTDGKDGWPLSITFDNIFWRMSGDYSIMSDALTGKARFTDPSFVAAAKAYQNFFYTSGTFDSDLISTDYGASRNLFGQQQAAMYIMGSWELGLASDDNFSDEFRSNVRAMAFPVMTAGKGSAEDLIAWYGGNYIVNAKSPNKELALEYVKFYAEMYPKLVWDRQAGFPAQVVQPKATDTQVAKDLLSISAAAAATSGTTALDMLDPEFKEVHQKLCKELAAGLITPEAFCKALDAAAQKAINK